MSLTNNTNSSLKVFRYWCYKVLPLVYDDSLSYYELLCKVYDYVNNIIEEDKALSDDVDELKQELAIVKEWIYNFDTIYSEKIIQENISTMIFIEITNAGYIVYNIPDNWNVITFNTTGLDIEVPETDEYGHLVLSY